MFGLILEKHGCVLDSLKKTKTDLTTFFQNFPLNGCIQTG